MADRRGATRRFVLVPPEPSEHELQSTCADALWRILLPDVQWTAVDSGHSFNPNIGRNGRPIGLIEVQQRKRRGVRAGVPDFLFWHQGRGYAIELKVGDGDLSGEQEEFCRGLLRAGCKLKVCWSLSQFIQTITDWGLVRQGVRVSA